MAKVKTYKVTKGVTDSHGNIYTILVYGEVTEVKALDGIEVRRVRFRHGDNKVVDKGESLFYPLGENCSPSKELNFGWAICSPNDTFDENIGIEICKKRFSKSPIKTQDCRFLKEDMVLAILNQTAEYVANNEFKAALEHIEADLNVAENFHNGEIVKSALSDAVFYALRIVDDENAAEHTTLVNWLVDTDIQVSNLTCKQLRLGVFNKNVRKATDEEKAKVQEYFRKRYNNQWDENNARFIKA